MVGKITILTFVFALFFYVNYKVIKRFLKPSTDVEYQILQEKKFTKTRSWHLYLLHLKLFGGDAGKATDFLRYLVLFLHFSIEINIEYFFVFLYRI